MEMQMFPKTQPSFFILEREFVYILILNDIGLSCDIEVEIARITQSLRPTSKWQTHNRMT